jgi:hypothetical protein
VDQALEQVNQQQLEEELKTVTDEIMQVVDWT